MILRAFLAALIFCAQPHGVYAQVKKAPKQQDYLKPFLKTFIEAPGLQKKPIKWSDYYVKTIRPTIPPDRTDLLEMWDRANSYLGGFMIPQTRVVRFEDETKIMHTLQFMMPGEAPIVQMIETKKPQRDFEVRLDGKKMNEAAFAKDGGVSAFRASIEMYEAMTSRFKRQVKNNQKTKRFKMMTAKQIKKATPLQVQKYALGLQRLVATIEKVDNKGVFKKLKKSQSKKTSTASILDLLSISNAFADGMVNQCMVGGHLDGKVTNSGGKTFCSSPTERSLFSSACGGTGSGNYSACKPEIYGRPPGKGAYCTTRPNSTTEPFSKQCLALFKADFDADQTSWVNEFKKVHGASSLSEMKDGFQREIQRIRDYCAEGNIDSLSFPPGIDTDQKASCFDIELGIEEVEETVEEVDGGDEDYTEGDGGEEYDGTYVEDSCGASSRLNENGECVPFVGFSDKEEASQPTKGSDTWWSRNKFTVGAIGLAGLIGFLAWKWWPKPKENIVQVSGNPYGGPTIIAPFPTITPPPTIVYSPVAPGGGPTSGSYPVSNPGTR